MSGRKLLVKEWAGKLQTPKSDELASDWDMYGPVPSQQAQSTALIILGMIGAEFHEGDRTPQTKRKSVHDSSAGEGKVAVDVMDPGVARKTGKTLQRVLLEKPHARSTLHSNLRCSAAELLGRGFQLWEKYIDIPQVSEHGNMHPNGKSVYSDVHTDMIEWGGRAPALTMYCHFH